MGIYGIGEGGVMLQNILWAPYSIIPSKKEQWTILFRIFLQKKSMIYKIFTKMKKIETDICSSNNYRTSLQLGHQVSIVPEDCSDGPNSAPPTTPLGECPQDPYTYNFSSSLALSCWVIVSITIVRQRPPPRPLSPRPHYLCSCVPLGWSTRAVARVFISL